MNGKDVGIFELFEFPHLLSVFADGDDAAVVQPRICVHCGKNFCTVDVCGCVIEYLDFGQFVIDIAYDIVDVRSDIRAEVIRECGAAFLYRINNFFIR